MKRVQSLRFETLEGRQMLSTAHPAAAHAARAAAVSLVLNGSLTVDNNPDAPRPRTSTVPRPRRSRSLAS